MSLLVDALLAALSLQLAPHVGLTEVRASPGILKCFRYLLDSPVPHAHVLRSSHPVPSILDYSSECDLFSSFALARDRPKDLKIFLEAVPPRRRRRSPRLSPCTTSRPNMIRFESLEWPCRTRAWANPS